MTLRQNVRRIDHVAILISPDNFETCIDRITRTLGVEFVRSKREDLGILAAIDWEAGLELVAPSSPSSPLWTQLQKGGEGQVSIIFGVEDLDAAKARARAEGFRTGPELGLNGEEPWASRFSVLREVFLSPFCGIRLALGQIEPSGT
jgi:hypothetical protein